mgnify:CR=1 FL=1
MILAKIRKGQFEGMAEKVQQPEWEPDFGGRRIHPTAGVVAVGCRPPLVGSGRKCGRLDEYLPVLP